ncbi:MAG: hypothetical protein AAFN92_01080, partial [Bacteroidota bacterium]
SDDNGSFTLVFQGIAKGTPIRLSVEKAGFEVVNRKELSEVVLGRLRPIKIFLAPKGQLEEARIELYNISRSALLQRHQRQIALLRKSNAQSESLIQELETKLKTEISNRFEAEEILNQQLAEVQRKLPAMALKLASVNLDFVSDMYLQAYEQLRAGKVEQAIATLDEAVLDEEAETLIQRIETSRAGRDSLGAAREVNLLSLDRLASGKILQARILVDQRRYSQAATVYLAAFNTLQHAKPDGWYLGNKETVDYYVAALIASINREYSVACALFEHEIVTRFSRIGLATPPPGNEVLQSLYLEMARRIKLRKP